MLKSLDDRFSSLARVAKELNTVSDQVSDSIRAVEDRLRALGLGVAVQLDSPMLSEDLGERQLHDTQEFLEIQESSGLPASTTESDVLVQSARKAYLAHAKLAGAWRLVVREYRCEWFRLRNDADDATPYTRDLVSERPLLDSSRDIRLAAAGQIDDLLVAIEHAAQERIARLQQSMQTEVAAQRAPDGSVDVDSTTTGRVGGRVATRRKVPGRMAR